MSFAGIRGEGVLGESPGIGMGVAGPSLDGDGRTFTMRALGSNMSRVYKTA